MTEEEKHEEREEEGEGGPLSKRRRLSPEEVERILNAKSSHDWAVREVGRSCDGRVMVM